MTTEELLAFLHDNVTVHNLAESLFDFLIACLFLTFGILILVIISGVVYSIFSNCPKEEVKERYLIIGIFLAFVLFIEVSGVGIADVLSTGFYSISQVEEVFTVQTETQVYELTGYVSEAELVGSKGKVISINTTEGMIKCYLNPNIIGLFSKEPGKSTITITRNKIIGINKEYAKYITSEDEAKVVGLSYAPQVVAINIGSDSPNQVDSLSPSQGNPAEVKVENNVNVEVKVNGEKQ